MNKNTIIALVIGLVIGGAAIWLFTFFAQGTSLGTAIGLNKTGSAPVDWSKYIAVQDKNNFSVKNGATTKKINQNTLAIITPEQYEHDVFCACDTLVEGVPWCEDGCDLSGGHCGGTCSGSGCGGMSNECFWHHANGEPITKPQGGATTK